MMKKMYMIIGDLTEKAYIKMVLIAMIMDMIVGDITKRDLTEKVYMLILIMNGILKDLIIKVIV